MVLAEEENREGDPASHDIVDFLSIFDATTEAAHTENPHQTPREVLERLFGPDIVPQVLADVENLCYHVASAEVDPALLEAIVDGSADVSDSDLDGMTGDDLPSDVGPAEPDLTERFTVPLFRNLLPDHLTNDVLVCVLGMREPRNNWHFTSAHGTAALGRLHLIQGKTFRASCEQHRTCPCKLMIDIPGGDGLYYAVRNCMLRWISRAENLSSEEHAVEAAAFKEVFSMRSS